MQEIVVLHQTKKNSSVILSDETKRPSLRDKSMIVNRKYNIAQEFFSFLYLLYLCCPLTVVKCRPGFASMFLSGHRAETRASLFSDLLFFSMLSNSYDEGKSFTVMFQMGLQKKFVPSLSKVLKSTKHHCAGMLEYRTLMYFIVLH